MRTVLMVAAALAALVCASVATAEGISPILKRPPVQLACQQKLCPGPKKPLVQLAEGDWQHMKRPLLAYGDLPCCAVKRPLVA